jgi:hypothetical protein
VDSPLVLTFRSRWVELRLEDVLVAGIPRTGADYLCQSGDMARVGGGNDVPGH